MSSYNKASRRLNNLVIRHLRAKRACRHIHPELEMFTQTLPTFHGEHAHLWLRSRKIVRSSLGANTEVARSACVLSS
eukprot:6203743-Pleurochrysis_carterae.AAC.3